MARFKEPNINISKVYTKTGDSGKSQLIGGENVYKDDIRVVAYGEVDELNTCIGICSNYLKGSKLKEKFSYAIERLSSIQNELFNLGTTLAATGSQKSFNLPEITKENIDQLEQDIDKMNSNLDSLKSFILPNGSDMSISFHSARVVCRRAERNIVTVSKVYKDLDNKVLIYINRLSDYLFVLGRYSMKISGEDENLWSPNKTTV